MNLRSARVVALLSFLTACASNPQGPSNAAAVVAASQRASLPVPAKRGGLGCYGTFGVEALPCPVKLTKRDAGKVSVSVTGPQVALATVIASDCAGSGSVCNVIQIGYAEFEITSVPGENLCGKGYVVFEGLTASESPIGTATVRVVNKYC